MKRRTENIIKEGIKLLYNCCVLIVLQLTCFINQFDMKPDMKEEKQSTITKTSQKRSVFVKSRILKKVKIENWIRKSKPNRIPEEMKNEYDEILSGIRKTSPAIICQPASSWSFSWKP